MTPSPANGLYGDLSSLGTFPGQNSAPPQEKVFTSHYIVQYNTTYYDPSYGVTYTSATNFADRAIYGYSNPNVIIGNALLVRPSVDNNGNHFRDITFDPSYVLPH